MARIGWLALIVVTLLSFPGTSSARGSDEALADGPAAPAVSLESAPAPGPSGACGPAGLEAHGELPLDLPAIASESTCQEGRGCSTSAQCDGGKCFRHKCFC